MTNKDKATDTPVQTPAGAPTEADVIDEALDSVGLSDEPTTDDQQDPLAGRIGTLEAELAAARQEVLYAQADTQNVRRRLEKDAQDARAYAATGFARDILSVADNLARALEAIPENLRGDEGIKGFVTGIEATQRELASVFERHGISRIESVGQPLDPNKHQAMVEIPSADVEPGAITHEMQAGYMIRDRLLRPALVGVAKKPD